MSDDVWHRIIQIVTGHKDLQAYAAENVFKALEAKSVHESAVLVGGYILGMYVLLDSDSSFLLALLHLSSKPVLKKGEFGYLIAEQPGTGGEAQFQVLHKHFPSMTNRTKALLLSTYVKLENLYPEVRDLAQPVFEKYGPSTELELQQRACEYKSLLSQGDEIMDAVLQGRVRSNEVQMLPIVLIIMYQRDCTNID